MIEIVQDLGIGSFNHVVYQEVCCMNCSNKFQLVQTELVASVPHEAGWHWIGVPDENGDVNDNDGSGELCPECSGKFVSKDGWMIKERGSPEKGYRERWADKLSYAPKTEKVLVLAWYYPEGSL